MSKRWILPPVASAALLVASASSAREMWSSDDGARSASLATSVKGTSVLSYAPDDVVLYSECEYGSSLWRLRFSLVLQASERARFDLAYENRVRISSEGASTAVGGLLPASAPAPYRIEQLDWDVTTVGDTYAHRHEIDRAYLAVDLAMGERSGQLTIGRQGIGMGRGMFFGAIDMFAPFSPTEVDRDWRRGVDAVKLDLPLGDTVSADVTGVFGGAWDESALVGRVRGYAPESGNDFAVVFGKRCEDALLGVSTSFRLGEASAYVDFAAFQIPEDAGDGRLFGLDHTTAKAVVGVSHKILGGDGPLIAVEYHYSGFGVSDIADLEARLAESGDPLASRLLRGDMQIASQHALAVNAAFELSDAWSGGITVVASPVDGSGTVLPSLNWNHSDNVTIVVSGLLPFGAKSVGGELQSEYGASPASLFLQIAVFD